MSIAATTNDLARRSGASLIPTVVSMGFLPGVCSERFTARRRDNRSGRCLNVPRKFGDRPPRLLKGSVQQAAQCAFRTDGIKKLLRYLTQESEESLAEQGNRDWSKGRSLRLHCGHRAYCARRIGTRFAFSTRGHMITTDKLPI